MINESIPEPTNVEGLVHRVKALKAENRKLQKEIKKLELALKEEREVSK